jgi:hypothetical protein
VSYEARRCDKCKRFARREALRFYDYGYYCSYDCEMVVYEADREYLAARKRLAQRADRVLS